MGLSARSSVG